MCLHSHSASGLRAIVFRCDGEARGLSCLIGRVNSFCLNAYSIQLTGFTPQKLAKKPTLTGRIERAV
jgi:hypothetical protein